MALVAASLTPLAAHLLFRIGYYGDLLPSTYYLKVFALDDRLGRGLAYLGGFAERYAVLLVFATATAVALWRRVPGAVSLFTSLVPATESARRLGLSVLPIGLKRSYGDSGLNQDGALIDMSKLDRLVDFDPATGVLDGEAGLSMAAVLAFAIPRGYFLPVVPGTQFITLGGAVANDVHGKNHPSAGTFGRFVHSLELVRTDGTVHCLSRGSDPLFAATIGGMGLTGIITRVAVQLEPIRSSFVEQRATSFGSLAEYFTLMRETAGGSAFAASWVDCQAEGRTMGRGLLFSGDHAADGGLKVAERPPLALPLPAVARSSLASRSFNSLYRRLAGIRKGTRRVSYDRFFFPLDRLTSWNRLYGAAGFFQFQSVVPPDAAEDATAEMLGDIATAGQGSLLTVLKAFGAMPSPGLMSFPMHGTTLALDFPNRGETTLALLRRLDAIVSTARGRIYPAKDGRTHAGLFRSGYPAMERFAAHVDPGISSSFWRRIAA